MNAKRALALLVLLSWALAACGASGRRSIADCSPGFHKPPVDTSRCEADTVAQAPVTVATEPTPATPTSTATTAPPVTGGPTTTSTPKRAAPTTSTTKRPQVATTAPGGVKPKGTIA